MLVSSVPSSYTGLRLRARMIGMIGVAILAANEIIPMTRMIAQIYKDAMENKENTPKGVVAKRPPPWGRGRRPRLCFLYVP